MKYNFKQIFALGTSALLIGMTAMAGVGAANYPNPFVVSGSANVGIVYGTGAGVSTLDLVQAGNIQSNLQSFMSGTTTTTTTTSGETVELDTSADRIWLNTSLNSIKSTLTKSDLPTVLADYTFSGDVTSKITSTIKLIAGNTAGGANSGKVIFAKQPTSSDDPVIGISLGSSQTSYPLYNASSTMSAINFTDPDSEGEDITLFGQSFTISSETDLTSIVLLKEAETVSLTNDDPSATVTINDLTYTITLISASDTEATIRVTDSSGASSSKSVNEAQSKRIQGLDVAVKTADESNFMLTAELIVGASKVTLTHGTIVTTGESDDPIDGTYAYLVGGTTATTEIAITVFRPDSSTDTILAGESFEDPVFGSFKVDFAGLSSDLDDTGREIISIQSSGDDSMTVKFTDDSGNEKTVDWAHNESGDLKLGDSSNFSMIVREMANISYAEGKAKHVVVGNEDYGHLLELYDAYNQTTGTSSITNDRIKFRDVMSGETHESTFTSTEGEGTIDVDGKRYTVTFTGTGEDAQVHLKYPTSESAAAEYVIYPTIRTSNSGLLGFYEPLTLNFVEMDGAGTAITKLWFPDGDGYTGVTIEYTNGTADNAVWNITGGGVSDEEFNTTLATDYVDFAIGQLTYNLTYSATNASILYLTDPEGTANLAEPSLVLFEGKDDNTEYHAVVVNLETAPAGTSTDGLGVDDVLFSSTYYHDSATRASDSDFTEDIDWFGTLVVKDSSDSDQKTATISYPTSQVYGEIYIGEISSVVSGGGPGGTALGDILVKDSEVSSVSTKNLIVVGGSCINSVAANLVGGALCGSSWTDSTSVGSGQFLIESFGDAYTTGKIALLVAGYDVAYTVYAFTFLRTQTVDTTAGNKYIGTTATQATLQVE